MFGRKKKEKEKPGMVSARDVLRGQVDPSLWPNRYLFIFDLTSTGSPSLEKLAKAINKLSDTYDLKHYTTLASAASWTVHAVLERKNWNAEKRAHVTSPETHPEWPDFLKKVGYTAEQYAILDENSKKSLRDSFRRRIRARKGGINIDRL